MGAQTAKPLYIFGAGGLAREIAYLARSALPQAPGVEWQVIGFVVASYAPEIASVGGLPIVGLDADVERLGENASFAIGVGTPAIVRGIAERLGFDGLDWPNLIHRTASADWKRIVLGVGNRICANVALTTDIKIGSHNLINVNCTVGHDAVIGSFCVINPGSNISGNVTVGDGCLIGTGATILQGLSIGACATVGAGAVVTRDVPAGATVAGIPAKPLVGKP